LSQGRRAQAQMERAAKARSEPERATIRRGERIRGARGCECVGEESRVLQEDNESRRRRENEGAECVCFASTAEETMDEGSFWLLPLPTVSNPFEPRPGRQPLSDPCYQ
jgi:hypothetical protein